jgi:hypothetical protein
MVPEILEAALQRIHRARFSLTVRRILQTPAVRLRNGLPFTLLSMVNHRDAIAYLLAAKSFCQQLLPNRVVVVADPTLTESDRSILQEHIIGTAFLEATDLRDSHLPRGGTWERLIGISEAVSDYYVIQLDADTVCVSRMEEVQAAIAANNAFLLSSGSGVQIQSLTDAAAWAQKRTEKVRHVQIHAEANLCALSGDGWRYARACSGFAGFPKGSFNREMLRQISGAISSQIGNRWHEWGSEQVTSNLVCASQPNAFLLPHPKYCNADQEKPETAFLHFIGYTRYANARYATVARQVIERLE